MYLTMHIHIHTHICLYIQTNQRDEANAYIYTLMNSNPAYAKWMMSKLTSQIARDSIGSYDIGRNE
jgi:hypothetical protein